MQPLTEFLNNNIGLVTIAVGLIAFAVYSRQRWDAKRAIASTILLEIQGAENALGKVKDYLAVNEAIPEDIVLMPNESWSRNRQDFVRDFDRDEWDLIGDFYSRCALYDEAARHNKQAFVKNEEQIRANAHRIVAEYANSMVEASLREDEKTPETRTTRDLILKNYNEIEELFESIYLTEGGITKPVYSPKKYLNQAKIYTSNVQDLSHTSIGIKLKKLEKRGWLRSLLHLYTR